MKRVGVNGIAGYKGGDGETHRWWWNCYELWENKRCQEEKKSPEVVNLMRRGVAPPVGTEQAGDNDDHLDMMVIGGYV